MLQHIPVPKVPLKLPTLFTQHELHRMIEAASQLMHRTVLMAPYSRASRVAESYDVDNERQSDSRSSGSRQ